MLPLAGVDLGGTKIQTTVFNSDWSVLESKRTDTPQSGYTPLLEALAEHISWATGKGTPQMPIGIGIPGVIDKRSGQLRTANLPANGQNIGADLRELTGRDVALVNDCKAFALAEAILGSGAAYRSVLGISIGTGIAGGLVIDKHILPDANSMAGEFGHMTLPASTVSHHSLPVIECGCGNQACYETYLCGPGFERLASLDNRSHSRSVSEWAELYIKQDSLATDIATRWFDILADLINQLTLVYDPDCIVFGGGMSNFPDFISLLSQALNNKHRLIEHLPALKPAHANEHSGAQGAALFAKDLQQTTRQAV